MENSRKDETEMTPDNQPALPELPELSDADHLRAASKRLRLGVEGAAIADALDSMADRIESLRRAEGATPAGWCTLGVGDGSGQLFVHGTHDAINACQALILKAEGATLGDGLREAWFMCHHPAWPDPLPAGKSASEALATLASNPHPDAWLLRTLTGGRVEYRGEKLAALIATPTAQRVAAGDGPKLHFATQQLVERFSVALAEKLAVAEAKYGYSDGWRDPNWMDECRAKLMEHIAKGDPRDVAAYCAFLWFHDAPTAIAAPPPTGEAVGVGVDVTAEGAHVSVRLGDTIVYSQFHSAPNQQPPVFWHDGRGHAITAAEKARSCAGDVEHFRGPLYTHPAAQAEGRGAINVPYLVQRAQSTLVRCADYVRSNRYSESEQATLELRGFIDEIEWLARDLTAALTAPADVDGEA